MIIIEKINNTYSVYIHTFPNKKVYIGITKLEPNKRWKNGKGYHSNQYMKNAINKYGWKNIEHEILFENLTKEEAEQKEVELIMQYKSNKRNFGYNILDGGNSNGTLPLETIKKISKSKKGYIPWNKGIKYNDEYRHKLSLAHKGKKIKKSKPSMGMLGKHHTEYTKLIMSIKKQGKKMPLEIIIKKSKPVIQYTIKNIYIDEFYGITEAYNKTKINISCISACCNGKRKTAGGYIWKFKEE